MLGLIAPRSRLDNRRTKSRSKSKPGSKRGFHRKSSSSAVVLDSSTGFHRSADSSDSNRDDGSNMALSGGIGMAISTRGSGRHRMLHEDNLSRSMPANVSTNALQLLEQGLSVSLSSEQQQDNPAVRDSSVVSLATARTPTHQQASRSSTAYV